MKDLGNIISALKRPFSFLSKNDEDINKQLNHLKELIEEKNLSSEEKTYLLATAIKKHSYEEIIKYLIELGANVNVFTEDGDPLLMFALKDTNLSLMKLLLKYNTDVNATNEKGQSILLISLIASDLETIELLIENNVYFDKEIDFTINSLKENRLIFIEYLITKNPLSDKEKNDFLFIANDVKIIEYLIEIGANVNSFNKNNKTLLMLAILHKDLPLVKLLLEKGVDINAKTDDGETALMWAAEMSPKRFVDVLLKNGVDINAKDNEGKMALTLSIESERKKISKMLIENGANINAKGILESAIKTFDKDIIEFLITKGIDINTPIADNMTLLMLASSSWSSSKIKNKKSKKAKKLFTLDFIKLLLEYGADVNRYADNNITALGVAIFEKRIDIVQLLLDHGADANLYSSNTKTTDETLLMYATGDKQFKIVQLLLKYGANINQKNAEGFNALAYAVGENYAVHAELLIENGADFNITIGKGNTLLMFAAEMGSDDTAKVLIKHGIDIYKKTDDGYNALYFAVIENQLPAVELLIGNGMDINETFDGKTLLLLATNQGHEHVVEFLLHQGVDVDTTSGGYTALMSASKNGYLKIVELLIHHNADINVKISRKLDDNYGIFLKVIFLFGEKISGKDALILSAENKHYDIVDILLSNGAKSIKSLGSIVLKNNDVRLLKVLIKHGYDVNSLSYIQFSSTISVDLLRVNLENGLDISHPLTFTQVATTVENLELILKVLKDEFPDENIGDFDILKMYYKYFLDNNNLELLKVLEDYDVTKGQSNIFVNMTSWMARNMIPFLTNIMLWPMLKLIIKNLKTSEQKQEIIRHFTTGIHLNLLHKALNSKIDIEQLKMFIDSSTDINIKDKNGLTPLMLASKLNNIEAAKLLLSKNANTELTDNSGKTALQYAADHEDIVSLLRAHMQKTEQHNPEKLVEILKNFTIDTPIKYTTHEWRNRIDKKYINNFDLFLNDVNNQLNEINNSLNNLSSDLYRKINSFILGRDESSLDWYSKGNLPVGWSSMEGLKEWVSTEAEPFDYPLPETISNNDQVFSKFGEVIELFKNEIEIRENMLQEIFLQHKKRLGRKFKINISDNLKGEKFYTDVEKFRNAIDEIFREIEEYAKLNDAYKVAINLHKPTDKFIELEIIHIGSYSHRDGYELLERIKTKKGDIGPLSDLLINLCDWFIVNKNYKINCFDTDKEPEALSSEAKGFTHIMRFYK